MSTGEAIMIGVLVVAIVGLMAWLVLRKDDAATPERPSLSPGDAYASILADAIATNRGGVATAIRAVSDGRDNRDSCCGGCDPGPLGTMGEPGIKTPKPPKPPKAKKPAKPEKGRR